jgi:hypothetical protein
MGIHKLFITIIFNKTTIVCKLNKIGFKLLYPKVIKKEKYGYILYRQRNLLEIHKKKKNKRLN